MIVICMFKVDEQRELKGEVFRVADMEHGACRKALWCRLDCKDDDWRLSFYDGLRPSEHDWNPMSCVPSELFELAVTAIRHAQAVIDRSR